MAWLWWLLAPVASTAVGGWVLWLRGHVEFRAARPNRARAMAEHRALLAGLATSTAGRDRAADEPELPRTMIVMSAAPGLDPVEENSSP